MTEQNMIDHGKIEQRKIDHRKIDHRKIEQRITEPDMPEARILPKTFQRLFTLIVILLGVAVPSWAQAPPESGTAVTIRALEREWTEGQSRNNNRALDLLFDNALVYVEYGRLVSKGDYLSRIRQQAPSIVTEGMTVHDFGTTAVVVGTYREVQLSPGHHLLRWRFIDTWVYKSNGWVLVSAGSAPIVK